MINSIDSFMITFTFGSHEPNSQKEMSKIVIFLKETDKFCPVFPLFRSLHCQATTKFIPLTLIANEIIDQNIL